MSLDVSPDGKTIAFDFLGDIYLMPITGGAANQFTSGMHGSTIVLARMKRTFSFISIVPAQITFGIFSIDKKDSTQVTPKAKS